MARSRDRWAARPFYGAAVSAFVFLVPLAAAIGVSWFAPEVVAAPRAFGLRVLWWLARVGLSAVVFTIVERVTRRLLPLAALLKMTLLFPDRAPSRLAVARRAGRTKDLEGHIDRAMHEAPTADLDDAAGKILSLAAALSSHDRRTRGHSERVRVLTDMIADELDLPESDRDRLRWSALLHDIGKLTVHPHILNKPGKPDPDEWAALHRHPLEGAKVVAPLAPWLGEWSLAVEQHHEQHDGGGYPYGLAGAAISYGARIVAVADVFETMTAKRSYKDAISPAMARAELTRCAGTQFDADVVRAFLNISLGELRWAVGPASLIAQAPFLGQLPLLGGQSTGALAGLSSATAFGAAALSVSSIVMPHGIAAPVSARQIDRNSLSATRAYTPVSQDGSQSLGLSGFPGPAQAYMVIALTTAPPAQVASNGAVPAGAGSPSTRAKTLSPATTVARSSTPLASPGRPSPASPAPNPGLSGPQPSGSTPPTTVTSPTTIAASPTTIAPSPTTIASGDNGNNKGNGKGNGKGNNK